MSEEKLLQQGDACTFLLSNEYFLIYQEMLKEELDRDRRSYLNYEDKTLTPEREDANRREFRGGMRLLQRVIDLPEKMKEKAKAERDSAANTS